MKAKTEYERKFGLSATKFIEDFERENAGLGSQQVEKSYAARDPPIQAKKRFSIVGAPASQRRLGNNRVQSDTTRESAPSVAAGIPVKPSSSRDYVILGNSDPRWPDRGGPGAAAPKTAYRLKPSSKVLARSDGIFDIASKSKEQEHHLRCKAKRRKNVKKPALPVAVAPAPITVSKDDPTPSAALVSLPNAPQPPPTPTAAIPGPVSPDVLPNTEINPALRKRAGLPTGIGEGGGGGRTTRSKGEKFFKSEYSREFVAKSLDSVPLHSPIMTAEKFYKGTIDLAHFPKDKENAAPQHSGLAPQPLTEYRKQFPYLPSSAYSRVVSADLNANNNNSNEKNIGNQDDEGAVSYDIISHFPRSKAGEDYDPVPRSSIEFLSRSSLPVPHLPPKSPASATYSTEYQSNFKPFDAFKYVDGAFREDAVEVRQSASSSSESRQVSPPLPSPPPPPPPANSWFSEVIELREKAAKYKERFSSDRFTGMRKRVESGADLVVEDVDEEVAETQEEKSTPAIENDESELGDEERDIGGSNATAPSILDAQKVDDDKDIVALVANEVGDDEEVNPPELNVGPEMTSIALSQGDLSLQLGDDDDDEENGKKEPSFSSSMSSIASRDQALPVKLKAPSIRAPASQNSHCDCGASVVSSSSSSTFRAPPPPPTDPSATYRSSRRGEKKRLKPNFVPATIRESMADTYSKPSLTSNGSNAPDPMNPHRSIANAEVRENDEHRTSTSDNERSPSPTDSVVSNASEMSSRSLSRAEDILQRAKNRQKQFWGN